VLSTSSYNNDDFTRMPFVGNSYLSQRLPAIGEGYQGDMGPAGYQLDTLSSTQERQVSGNVRAAAICHGS
jgi:hypothetical protein